MNHLRVFFAHCVKSKQNSSQKSIARHDISNCNNLCFCEKKISSNRSASRALSLKRTVTKIKQKRKKKKLMLLVRSKIQIKIITTTKQKKHLMKMPNYLWYTILVFSLKYVSLLVVWKRLWLWRNTTASLRCKST